MLTPNSVAVKQPVAIGCLWGATAFTHSKLGKYKFVSLVDGPIDLSAPVPISAADVKVMSWYLFDYSQLQKTASLSANGDSTKLIDSASKPRPALANDAIIGATTIPSGHLHSTLRSHC